jgi:hypothetical protein
MQQIITDLYKTPPAIVERTAQAIR